MAQVGLGGILLTLTGTPYFQSADIGPQVLHSCVVGHGAGNVGVATGQHNVAVGENALQHLTTAGYVTALGSHAFCQLTTGVNCVAIGAYAAYSATTASYTVAIGQTCLTSLTTGDGNVGVGCGVLSRVNTGTYNTGLADNCLYSLTTGNFMIGIGYNAGYGITPANAPVTDDDGILIGHNANRSVASATVLTNYIGIGVGVLIDKSNQIKLGNPTITEINLHLTALPAAANNAGAAAAGILVGGLYRTNADPSVVCIRSA